jgi:hypothetical protein
VRSSFLERVKRAAVSAVAGVEHWYLRAILIIYSGTLD